ncbi:hypothetical protein M446_2771 [Methylobacterium sp. 4-46]|uniref:hypothetical protein n=1 Tax=unclassified Methylobacterium TaxID=2615210 RepID=UPI000152D11F|nr:MULTISPECIES: hypothetical protein [Methylobacterium]ACA17209.1 hypothetical protein M446_2771 [Methylobacterium sp. 4-46]WFT82891.1 hypothetical protein QA634_14040 [Methylobacterium nodulans]
MISSSDFVTRLLEAKQWMLDLAAPAIQAVRTLDRDTWLLGGVAAGLLVLALLLRVLARRDRTARDLVEATQRAVALQAAGMELQREASERQLRAYVGVTFASFQRFAPGQDLVVQIELRNHGLTPALDLVANFTLAVEPFPAASLPSVTAAADRLPCIVGARETRLVTRRVNLQAAPGVAERLLSSELGLYLVGQVTYRDVFGREHLTSATLVASGDRIRGREPFVLCEGGNAVT